MCPGHVQVGGKAWVPTPNSPHCWQAGGSSSQPGSHVAPGGGHTGSSERLSTSCVTSRGLWPHRQPLRQWEGTPGRVPTFSPGPACPGWRGGGLGPCPHDCPHTSEITTQRGASTKEAGKADDKPAGGFPAHACPPDTLCPNHRHHLDSAQRWIMCDSSSVLFVPLEMKVLSR